MLNNKYLYGFATAILLPQSCPKENPQENISLIQTFTKFYANLYQVITFYTNLRKFMQILNFFTLIYAVREACTRDP